jgi:hypothetical protein
MPSFGARSRFAVEYDLLPDHAGVWMNGYCRYWIGDQQVGDFSIITSLRDALFQFEGMRRDVGKRQNPRFLAMSPAHMFRLVDAGLFGSRDISPLELAEKEQWARHNITPGIDVGCLRQIGAMNSAKSVIRSEVYKRTRHKGFAQARWIFSAARERDYRENRGGATAQDDQVQQ